MRSVFCFVRGIKTKCLLNNILKQEKVVHMHKLHSQGYVLRKGHRLYHKISTLSCLMYFFLYMSSKYNLSLVYTLSTTVCVTPGSLHFTITSVIHLIIKLSSPSSSGAPVKIQPSTGHYSDLFQ